MKFLILFFAFATIVASEYTGCHFPHACPPGWECKKLEYFSQCVPKKSCEKCHGYCGFERTCRDGCCVDIVPRFPPIRDEGCVFVKCASNQRCVHGICFNN